ncbi:MAG: 16S rRNA (guanine(527)-N(7))-methyltransferase RsmG [Desulfoplanes sp.]|nr:16S rRNA (guanine(527)-N(7))-methyltransferase RsmG [Desulfoplanes sp.]
MTKPISPEAVARQTASLGRKLTNEQARSLTIYLELLEKWNKKMNLVGPRDWQTMLATLMIDSWNLADVLQSLDLGDGFRTLDLGAGAGLPGIPLRVFWDQGEYILVESRQKRAIFMRTVLATMGLGHIKVAGCRIENLDQDLLPARLVVSRAFCPWRDFLAIAEPLLEKDGYCLVMSNEPTPTDVPSGWHLVRTVPYLVNSDQRSFWLFSPKNVPS